MNKDKIFITIDGHTFEAVRIDAEANDEKFKITERYIVKQKTVLGEVPFEIIIHEDGSSYVKVAYVEEKNLFSTRQFYNHEISIDKTNYIK